MFVALNDAAVTAEEFKNVAFVAAAKRLLKVLAVVVCDDCAANVAAVDAVMLKLFVNCGCC